MLKRIVRMTFQEDQVDYFIENVFNPSKNLIRNFKGCKHLELHRDKNKSNILYTYSLWDSETSLELYRNSDLFKNTWANTKILFADKPVAFSLEELQVV